MRDIAIALIVFACFVVSLRKPYIGFLSWEWLSLMTPHKLAYGFVVTMPVALIAILGTLIGLLFERNKGKLFQHGIVGVQLLFLGWTALTTFFALFPDNSLPSLTKFSKIMLGVCLSYLVVTSREKFNWLVWVMFLSVGFYGIKGGLFTLSKGGAARVYGPEDSFLEENNALACALLMILPFGFYLMRISQNPRVKQSLIIAMGLIGVSVLGSQSRGALIGLSAMLVFWMRNVPGRQKLIAIVVALFIVVVALTVMPQSYWDRMNTVKTYDQDSSAMGRINAWWCTYNIAKDRFTGTGFDFATPYAFALYAPDPLDIHTAHSIYFQVLGDHGFIGLMLFLWIMIWTWLLLGKIIRQTQGNAGMDWANNYVRMSQLSLISYGTAGAFLSLSYYDLYWQIVANCIILHTLMVNFKTPEDSPTETRGNPVENVKPPPQPFVRRCDKNQ